MYRVVLLGALLAVGCGKRESAAKENAPGTATQAPAVGDLVRPGRLTFPRVETVIGVAIPKGGDVAAAESVARERAAADKLEVQRVTLDALGFDRAWIAVTAKPISDAEAAALLESEAVIAVRGNGSDGVAVLRSVARVASAIADASHGWVLEPGVAGVYTAESFHERIPGSDPDVRSMIVVHAVSGDGDLPYLDTMGMRRLGLPDLYVGAAGRGQLDRYMTLLDAVAQTMLDQHDITRMGEIDIDLGAFGNDWHIEEVRARGGSGKATLRLRWSKGSADHGDNGELSIEVTPPGGPAPEVAEEVLDACFGEVPDELTYVSDDDPELLAAGVRARAELAKLGQAFAKGVPPDAPLSVKARFTDDNGTEWMWVDVVRWNGKIADGTLANTPEIVTTVKEGQRVKVKLDDVADYKHTAADGTQAGGYSIEVFRKRGLLD